MGNFKTLLLREFLPDQFQIISATTLGGPSQNLFLGILNFAFIDFYFKFLLTWEYMGPEISKRYSSESSCPINSKLFLQQPWLVPHKGVAQNFEFRLYWFKKNTLNFLYHWSIWGRKCQNATPLTVLARSIPNYFINLGWTLTKHVTQNF